MAGSPSATSALDYRTRLREDREWARRELGEVFGAAGLIFEPLRRLPHDLGKLGITYALSGDLALCEYGNCDAMPVVELVVRREDLPCIRSFFKSFGYHAIGGGNGLRHLTADVRVRFLVTGQYPGDGKPKPVAFPDPAEHTVEMGGIKVLNLPKLIDLKLASGLSNERRMKDLVDVQSLIETLKLPADFAEKRDPSVRAKFLDLHRIVTEVPDPYAEG